MKKILLYILMLLLSLSIFGCGTKENGGQQNQDIQQPEKIQQTDDMKEKAVSSVVEKFGSKLQNVSLMSPKDVLVKSIEENYRDLVSPELLSKWMNEPQNAPGRLLSSPWPDRIEILDLEKISETEYKVNGEIIEITSTEKTNGGIAGKQPISVLVKAIEEQWVIDDITLGAIEETSVSENEDALVYENTEYGFSFPLPSSWENFTIVSDKWEGLSLEASQNGKVIETGPIISIRHPQWTAENPRQDIPIMIFTLNQWESLQKEEFAVGAAPMGPRELGRNGKYVFALPARYNYAFPTGYEEVEEILESNPLQTLE